MLGFLLTLLIPIKIAAAAVLLYLFLKLAVAAETPNSQTTNPNLTGNWSSGELTHRARRAGKLRDVKYWKVIPKKNKDRVVMDYI